MQKLDKYTLITALQNLYPFLYDSNRCGDLAQLTFEEVLGEITDTELSAVRLYLELEP